MWPELRELPAAQRHAAIWKFLQTDGLSAFDTQLAIRDLLRTHVELKSQPKVEDLVAKLMALPIDTGDDGGVPIAEILYDAFGERQAALAILERSLEAAHVQPNLALAARDEIEVLGWFAVIKIKNNEEPMPVLLALQSRLVHQKPRLPILKRLRSMLPADCPPKLKQILDRL
jgi:hypothetical protein